MTAARRSAARISLPPVRAGTASQQPACSISHRGEPIRARATVEVRWTPAR